MLKCAKVFFYYIPILLFLIFSNIPITVLHQCYFDLQIQRSTDCMLVKAVTQKDIQITNMKLNSWLMSE